jgi:hypothetical protein
MATKKKTTKKTAVIEEPVVIKVLRTVKKKFSDQAAEELASIRQEVAEPKEDDSDDDTEIDEEHIEVRRFMTEPARVNYHYNLGRNTHYQSVSIGVSVTLPCYREEVEGALAEAKQIVADRLKLENRKTGAVLDHLVNQRIEKDQELAQRGIR